jgi:hypothetical protein
MTLKAELYSQNRGVTLAENIDKAWEVYIDEHQDREDREVAQGFLLYAFNIKHTDNIQSAIVGSDART